MKNKGNGKKGNKMQIIGFIVFFTSAVSAILIDYLTPFDNLIMYVFFSQLAVGGVIILTGAKIDKAEKKYNQFTETVNPFKVLGLWPILLIASVLMMYWTFLASQDKMYTLADVFGTLAIILLISSPVALIIRYFKEHIKIEKKQISRLPFFFMFTVWGLYLLTFATLPAPGILTGVSLFSALFFTFAWIISEKVTKISTKNNGFFHWTDKLMVSAQSMDKASFDTLKRVRVFVSVLGISLCLTGAVIHCFLNKTVVFEILFALIFLAGYVTVLSCFTYPKFAVLKYIKFDSNGINITTIDLKVDKVTENIPITMTKIMKTEEKTEEEKSLNNRIIGCLVGGAAGDALGYTVEFMRYDDIIKKYGKNGITEYSVDPKSDKALISDDTQMTLFTAEGLLSYGEDDITNIYNSYKNWLITQNEKFDENRSFKDSELMKHRELFARRAPGNTCISTLSSGLIGTVTNPVNSSKGCGGVMRVAPIALINYYDEFRIDKLAAQVAAITHGHPLGYLPAAFLVHIIHKAVYGRSESLLQIITESKKRFAELFASAPHLDDMMQLVSKAIALSDNKKSDVENINELGEGWVAEETLAIAVYCALRYSNDFSSAITAAVNHNGDSDSTGAVTGNILGAYLGFDKIDQKWKNKLELYDLIVKMSYEFEP